MSHLKNSYCNVEHGNSNHLHDVRHVSYEESGNNHWMKKGPVVVLTLVIVAFIVASLSIAIVAFVNTTIHWDDIKTIKDRMITLENMFAQKSKS